VNLGHIQQTADALIAHGDIPPAIIVMPDADSTWFVDRKEKMETAVIHDLIGDVEHTLRALDTRNGRLVAGLSMGGYGALRFVLKYPEMFAAAALLSPAIYDPEPPQGSGARRAGVFGGPDFDSEIWKQLNYPALWDAFLAKKIAVPMYINSGDDDDYFIEAEATRLYSLLRRNGQPAELRIVDGPHRWTVWESTIGDALCYIFRYSARPAIAPADATRDAKARKSR
jgi:enterochelin esterase-like enzyme